MTTREALQEALDALPDSAEGIAAMLAAEGISGERERACACPLAIWLSRRLGAAHGVWDTHDGGFEVGPFRKQPGPPGDTWLRLPLTPAGCEFVKAFDSEDYTSCDPTWVVLVAG